MTKPAKVFSSPNALQVQFFNRQNTRRINLAMSRQIVRRLVDELAARHGRIGAAECLPLFGHLGVHFITSVEMARLNETFLSHAGSTDVITFNYQEAAVGAGLLCGELFISVDDAVASAPRFRTSWQPELVRYLVHGVLHLQGYDDSRPAARRTMKRLENRLLKKLSQRFDWGKLERPKNATRRK